MSDGTFHSLQGLLNDIFSGDSEMSLESFREMVESKYDAGELSGTQYDWLLGNIEEWGG